MALSGSCLDSSLEASVVPSAVAMAAGWEDAEPCACEGVVLWDAGEGLVGS